MLAPTACSARSRRAAFRAARWRRANPPPPSLPSVILRTEAAESKSLHVPGRRKALLMSKVCRTARFAVMRWSVSVALS